MFLRRRRLIATTGLAAASLGLPRIAIGQGDQRPSITIAVQQIANSASLEPLREQSNVGQRVFSFLFEPLIMQNLLGKLEAVPGVAESWKRIDELLSKLEALWVFRRGSDDAVAQLDRALRSKTTVRVMANDILSVSSTELRARLADASPTSADASRDWPVSPRVRALLTRR